MQTTKPVDPAFFLPYHDWVYCLPHFQTNDYAQNFCRRKIDFQIYGSVLYKIQKNFFPCFETILKMHLLSTNSFSGNVGLKITQIIYMFCGYSKENDSTKCVLNMSNQLCNSLEVKKLGAKGYNLCLKGVKETSVQMLNYYILAYYHSLLIHLLFLYKTLKPPSSALNFSSVEQQYNNCD